MSQKIKNTNKFPYSVHPYHITDGISYLETAYGDVPLQIFGRHNLSNLNAARLACQAVGVSDENFYKAISSFKGASKRLELVAQNGQCAVYKDFAHSPSKLKATVSAVREQFPDRKLIACMELHTFSSLTGQFLKEYKGAMNQADESIVFFDPHAIALKKLPPITAEMITDAFQCPGLEVFNDSKQLYNRILQKKEGKSVFLLMSSGNFGGINIDDIAKKIVFLQV